MVMIQQALGKAGTKQKFQVPRGNISFSCEAWAQRKHQNTNFHIHSFPVTSVKFRVTPNSGSILLICG